jgi:lysine-specific demethylase 8
VLEDDLFGGQDENDVEPVEEGDDAVGSIEEQDGGRALEQVLERLDSRSNHSQYGSVPTPIAARLFAYLIQNGTTLIQKLGKADNPPAVDERNILARCVDGARERDFSLCRIVGCDLEDLLYRQLRRRGSWHSLIYREAYWCSVLSAAIGYAHEGSFLESLGLLDKGLILGLPRTQHSLEPFVEYVETHASQVALGPMWPCVSAAVPDYRLVDHRRAAEGPGLARGIDHAIEERHSLLSFHEFLSAFAHGGKPVVLRGFASNWSALDTMRDLRHLSRDHGHRLVPIEVGSILRRRSSDVSMKEKIMTIRQFVDSFLVPSTYQGIWSLKDAVDSPASRVAYVAQHPLMMQILALRREVVMCPDLCGPSGPSHVNAWIGTGGTRTPLHFDSYDNLLVQLVGIKYVRLYGTEDAQKLPRLTVNGKASSFGLQGNMSSLNCECEDRDECGPNESFAYSEALLFPGDCLFIPTRVWHYVRSITTSMSINYWFDVQ